MSFIAAGAAAVSATVAVAKMVQGGVEAKRAREDAAKAKKELDKGKELFSNIDTSNPYLNLENTMEDLTVNKQAAEFQKQQSMQTQSNIMQQMRGAAGGSGIAALAQSMAQQGSMDAQKASADIGRQEAANQKAERGMAGTIQMKEREGDMLSRNQQFGKISSMMGMSAGELAGAQQRQQAGQEAVMEGGKDIATAAVDYGVNTGEIEYTDQTQYGSNVGN
jgi:hypothetical protein